jgi:hypothetical protein
MFFSGLPDKPMTLSIKMRLQIELEAGKQKLFYENFITCGYS